MTCLTARVQSIEVSCDERVFGFLFVPKLGHGSMPTRSQRKPGALWPSYCGSSSFCSAKLKAPWQKVVSLGFSNRVGPREVPPQKLPYGPKSPRSWKGTCRTLAPCRMQLLVLRLGFCRPNRWVLRLFIYRFLAVSGMCHGRSLLTFA